MSKKEKEEAKLLSMAHKLCKMAGYPAYRVETNYPDDYSNDWTIKAFISKPGGGTWQPAGAGGTPFNALSDFMRSLFCVHAHKINWGS